MNKPVLALVPESDVGLRQLPQNVQAEQALLGALLSNNRAYARVQDFLRGEHFADEAHAAIFDAIAARVSANGLADPVTLRDELVRSGALDAVGGVAYLNALPKAMVGIVSVADYGRVIFDTWKQRRIVEISSALTQGAFGAPADNLPLLVSGAVQQIDTVLDNGSQSPGASLDQAMASALEAAQAAASGQGTRLVRLGLQSLDEAIGGLEAGTMAVLAARPMVGKTSLAMQWAIHVAQTFREEAEAGGERRGVLVISLEMTAAQLGRRVLSRVSGVSVADMKRGSLSGKGPALVRATKEMAGLPLWIEDAPGQDVRAIEAKCRAAARRFGRIGLVIVDHMQKVRRDTMDRKHGDTQAIGQISNRLAELAKVFNCPMVALSQLSRDSEKRDDHRPGLADLRSSGDIEQDADTVMMLYRPELHGKSEPTRQVGQTEAAYQARVRAWEEARARDDGRVEVILAKVREGSGGVVNLVWDGPTASFSEADAPEPQLPARRFASDRPPPRHWQEPDYFADDPGPESAR